MKVLVTTGLYPPEIGGPATYTRFLETRLPVLGYSVSVIPFSRVRKYWPVVRHIAFFFQVLAEGKDADVIYAQDTVSVGVPSWAANLFLRKKFLVRVPGDHVWEQGTRRFGVTEPLERFPLYDREWNFTLTAMRYLQQLVVKSARAVVVPSKYMLGIVKRWNLEPKRAVLIYNGVESLKNTGNKPVLRGLLKFQGKLIIGIGRLVPWKGFDGLIAAMPDLRKEFPDAKLLVVGDGPLLSDLEAQAASLGLSDDVIFAGKLERDVLLRYIRAADVFVLNSRYEGLSHQLLEVMAVGVPVVATAAGGNPEVIDHGVNGYLYSVGEREKMRMYVSNLLRDATLRAKIAAAAKRKVAQFSEERMAEETAKLLKRL